MSSTLFRLKLIIDDHRKRFNLLIDYTSLAVSKRCATVIQIPALVLRVVIDKSMRFLAERLSRT